MTTPTPRSSNGPTQHRSSDAVHLAAQAALAGLAAAELPKLASATDVDPATTILVQPVD